MRNTTLLIAVLTLGSLVACSSQAPEVGNSSLSKGVLTAPPKTATAAQLKRSQEQVEEMRSNYASTKDYSRGLGFGKETQLDKDLEGSEYIVEDISLDKRRTALKVAKKEESKKNYYTLQFATIGNFDAAQNRKYELAEKYGLSLHLKFDPPFYKLQGGSYSDKQKAEDRAADLRDSGISAFVVKVK